MKQSRTTLKELTAAYRAVLKHGILCNAIALGLVAMPAMAEDYTARRTIAEGEIVQYGPGDTFKDIPVANSGGALFMNTLGTLIIRGTDSQKVVFSGNQAKYGGGAIYDNNGILSIDNAIFSNNVATNSTALGGAVRVGGTNEVKISNSEFSGNYTGLKTAGGSGGAIYNQGTGDLILTDNTFSGNGKVVDSENVVTVKTNMGGAIYNNAGALQINGGSIENNVAKTGGAIYMKDGSLNIDGTTISENKSSNGQGVIYVTGGEGFTIKDANITDNVGLSDTLFQQYSVVKNDPSTYSTVPAGLTNANSNGGAIYNNVSGKTSSINGGSLSRNIAYSGGAIYNNNGKINISGTNFDGNVAMDLGGAIYNTNGEGRELTITNKASFTRNTAKTGGAIYNAWKTTLTDVVFGGVDDTNAEAPVSLGNVATANGGAIYNTSILNVNGDSAFIGNTASENGGAIYNKGTMTIDGATFTSNVASGDAGAIAVRGKEDLASETTDMATLKITDGTFVNNKSVSTEGIGGAIVAERNSNVIIEDSEFTSNTAAWGGAIYSYAPSEKNGHSVGGYVTIENTKFSDNEALGVGAVGIFSEAKIHKATFENNRATDATDDGAGALFFGSVSKSDMLLSGSSFKSNYSASVGGAVATRGSGADGVSGGNNNGALLDISDVTFTSNTAGTKGGAFYNAFHGSTKHSGYVNLANARFEKNTATDGGAIYNSAAGSKDSVGGKIYGTNLIFSNNSASGKGGAIYNNVDFVLAGVNKFAGNKAGDKPNDIYNDGALTIAAKGTTTMNGGIDGNGSLTIEEKATLNIGTASINQDSITLNGTLIANLVAGSDAILNATTSFEGDGKLSLAIEKDGTYNLFGGKVFAKAQEQITSSVYDLDWSTNNGGTVIASLKTADTIASETGLETETAAAFSRVAQSAAASEAKQMKALSLKLQEKLADAENNPAALEAVEHATKAVHPETESVTQSVSTSVQNTVVNLASARMVMPALGRAGGDVNLTSSGAWVQGLFNKSKQNDAFEGNTRGIAAGIDGTINKIWTIGAGYSFAHSDIDGTARDTEIDSNTVFVYGQYKPSAWYLNAVLNYTWSDYSEDGTVIENTPVFADYDVKSFGGNVATGYTFDSGITPELGLRYIHVTADDYTNSFGIKTHMDDTDYLTGILGAKYAFNIVANKHTVFTPQLNAGVKYDLLSDKHVATVTMPGLDSYSMDGNRLNRMGGEFGIGLGVKYGNLDMSVNYDIDVRNDYTSQTGMLKFRCNF